MADLIVPHGGLAAPVCRTVGAEEIDSFKAEAAGLTKVPVSAADLSTVYRLGDGTLSPLTGPMNRATYNRVLDESVIEHNGKLYAWTIPLAFPVTEALAGQLKPGQRSASTSNRNFEGRQGPGGRTHLVSPAMAAAAAVTGHFTDVRRLLA